MSNKLLGEILVKKGYVSQEQLNQAFKEPDIQEDMLGTVLVNKGLLKEEELFKALSEQVYPALF